MIRTGDEYRDFIRDGREVCVTCETVAELTTHPQFNLLVDKALVPVDSKLRRI